MGHAKDFCRSSAQQGMPPFGEYHFMSVSVTRLQSNPAHLVILAVRAIVSALTSAKFIAAQQHWNPSRDKQGQEERLDQGFRIPSTAGSSLGPATLQLSL
jgi:hypothetical protein